MTASTNNICRVCGGTGCFIAVSGSARDRCINSNPDRHPVAIALDCLFDEPDEFERAPAMGCDEFDYPEGW